MTHSIQARLNKQSQFFFIPKVSFEGIWSKDTHPKDFPENKWLLHFSDIIGASHSAQFYFWETGSVASEGIRHVAEWGATRILENELKANVRISNISLLDDIIITYRCNVVFFPRVDT